MRSPMPASTPLILAKLLITSGIGSRPCTLYSSLSVFAAGHRKPGSDHGEKTLVDGQALAASRDEQGNRHMTPERRQQPINFDQSFQTETLILASRFRWRTGPAKHLGLPRSRCAETVIGMGRNQVWGMSGFAHVDLVVVQMWRRNVGTPVDGRHLR
jgi:hypothetical protein